MSFPAYPEYRSLKAEWSSKVPSRWQAKRLRFACRLSPSKSEIDLPEDAPVSFVPMEAVGEYGGLDLSREKVLEEIGAGYTYFAEGDVVVAKITPCFENGKGALAAGLANKAAFGTTELHVLRPLDDLDARFLFYLTISQPFRKIGEAAMYGAGGQKRISDDFIKDFVAGLPPRDEQLQIANFLDRETARTDALIEKKRRLLDLLEEKRLAVITQAVTKGLDPTVPMKDSGIEWLGEVPEHWDAVEAKRMISFITSGSRGWASYYSDEGSLFIQSGNIGRYLELDFETLQRVNPPDGMEEKRTTVQIDDVLVCVTGARTGSVAHVNALVEEAFINQHVALLRPLTDRIHPRLLAYTLWSKVGISQFEVRSYGLKEGLGLNHIASIWISLPPLQEQSSILRYLDAKLLEITQIQFLTNNAVKKLFEYRAALITNAVTGKIDVRGLIQQEEAA